MCTHHDDPVRPTNATGAAAAKRHALLAAAAGAGDDLWRSFRERMENKFCRMCPKFFWPGAIKSTFPSVKTRKLLNHRCCNIEVVEIADKRKPLECQLYRSATVPERDQHFAEPSCRTRVLKKFHVISKIMLQGGFVGRTRNFAAI